MDSWLFYLLVLLTPHYSVASSNVVLKTNVLKEFTVQASDYELRFPNGERSYGTQMRGSYTTLNIESLEDYGMVQFVQGCVFTSRLKNGKVERVHDIARRHFGNVIPFHHPTMVIDSFTKDPMDWSSQTRPQLPRHALYKWNQISGDPNSMVYYYESPPSHPNLYVTTLPGTAFYLEEFQEARNLSLQFKTCIYHTQNIPPEATPLNTEFASPIQCHSWQSSFIFDHQKEEFTSPQNIDPFCHSQSEPHLSAKNTPSNSPLELWLVDFGRNFSLKEPQ